MKLTLVAHKVKGVHTPSQVLEKFLKQQWAMNDESFVVTISKNETDCHYCKDDRYACPWHKAE